MVPFANISVTDFFKIKLSYCHLMMPYLLDLKEGPCGSTKVLTTVYGNKLSYLNWYANLDHYKKKKDA